MSLTPFSRDAMRELKANKDEEAHILMINSVVKQLYEETLRFAERTRETVYKINMINKSYNSSKLPSNSNTSFHHNLQIASEYVREHMEEILTHLRRLFPDCSVEYKKVSMARGRDGIEYDITTMDNILLSFIDVRQGRTEEYIMIDWT
jgi:hypothetical protein